MTDTPGDALPLDSLLLDPNPDYGPYGSAFEAALSELGELMSERETLDERRDTIDKRINRLRNGIFGLGALCDLSVVEIKTQHPELFPDSIDPDTGLTDAVRNVLKGHKNTYVSPVHIRDVLRNVGYEISKYKNVLASIHSILKRLKNQGEVLDSNREGRTVYKWADQSEQPGELRDEDIPF